MLFRSDNMSEVIKSQFVKYQNFYFYFISFHLFSVFSLYIMYEEQFVQVTGTSDKYWFTDHPIFSYPLRLKFLRHVESEHRFSISVKN